jgi:hypothetical protein
MPFKYQSGDEVRVGDRVRYADDAGEVVSITETAADDDDPLGVMLKLMGMGLVLLPTTEDEEELDLVRRSTKQPLGRGLP